MFNFCVIWLGYGDFTDASSANMFKIPSPIGFPHFRGNFALKYCNLFVNKNEWP